MRVSRQGIMAGLLFVIVCQEAQALDPQRAITQALLRKWQFQQGLPQATVLAIRQTSDDYLWLGTQSGLFRFDGVRFVPAPTASGISLAGVWVNSLVEDRDHALWIATNDAGVVRLHERVAVNFGFSDGLPSMHVRCALLDRRGDLWVGTDEGLARWLPRDGKFRAWQTAQGLATDDVHDLCEAGDGTIWIAGEGARVSLWDGSALSSKTLSSLPSRTSVHALCAGQDGSVWVGTTSGLVHVTDGKEVLLTESDGLSDNFVECLAESRDGTLWVGTRDGLSQSTVYSICEDHEGSVWVGTKHGLNQFVDRLTIPLTVSEGLPGNDTGPILEDETGAVWVGTLGQGLARYEGGRFSSVLTGKDGLPADTVLALARGRAGEFWVGTTRGVCLMRDGKVVKCFTTDDGLPSNLVSCLCCDQEGALWAGTALGLAEFTSGRFTQPDGDEALVRQPFLAMIDLGSEGLVGATEAGGLVRCRDKRVGPFSEVDHHDLSAVSALYFDHDGLLWMGTRRSGLLLVDGTRTFQFSVSDGLYDDELFGIVADDEDRLWMACSRGIFFVSRADLRRFAAGELTRLTSTPFSPTDAQRTLECQSGVQPVTSRMRDGRIWFSTIHGVIIIDPAHVRRVVPPPKVIVEEAQINGRDVDPGAIGRLGPGQTNCSFRYTALSLASPTRITFRYRLDSFDRDWIEAGARREAFYTNLPPGNYRFRVSAATRDAPWIESKDPVEFTVAPFFYQTRWFLPMTGLGVVLAGWLAFRLRDLQVKSRLEAVLAERSRIARELHDTLIQGFSGVTMQMQGLAARLRPSAERSQLEEIIHDAGNCLRDARRSVGGLRSATQPRAGLADSVAQAAQQLTEMHDVRLVLHLAHNEMRIPAEAEYHVLRIAQEAIANAVKHSQARTIEVSMSGSPEDLQLLIRDDGIGFSAETDGHLQAGHYGLIGMRERASQLGAVLRIDSQPGQGTTVGLTLSLNGAAGPGRIGGAHDEHAPHPETSQDRQANAL